MPQTKLILASAALCAGLGTAAFADASALQKFPGAKEAITNYYGANAREANCGAGHITDIGDAKVVSESGDSAVVAVNYVFSATPGAGGTQCSGDSSRQFTLTKAGSAWTVSGMSGQAP